MHEGSIALLRMLHAFLYASCMSLLLQKLCTLAVFEYLKQRAWPKNVGWPHDTSVINHRNLVLRVICQIRPYKVQPKSCTCAASSVSYSGQALLSGQGKLYYTGWYASRHQQPPLWAGSLVAISDQQPLRLTTGPVRQPPSGIRPNTG